MRALTQTRLYTTLLSPCRRSSPWKSVLISNPSARSLSSSSSVLGKDDLDRIFSQEAEKETRMIRTMKELSAQDQAVLAQNTAESLSKEPEFYSFHVYSHKHNTHITLTKPNREPIISVSCGNLGFKKGGRGSFDAAFQLAAYVLNKMRENPKQLKQIVHMQYVLRGFGPGREAVNKAMLGSEGYAIKNKIKRVVDSTRIKFGGTRSKAPRRL